MQAIRYRCGTAVGKPRDGELSLQKSLSAGCRAFSLRLLLGCNPLSGSVRCTNPHDFLLCRPGFQQSRDMAPIVGGDELVPVRPRRGRQSQKPKDLVQRCRLFRTGALAVMIDYYYSGSRIKTEVVLELDEHGRFSFSQRAFDLSLVGRSACAPGQALVVEHGRGMGLQQRADGDHLQVPAAQEENEPVRWHPVHRSNGGRSPVPSLVAVVVDQPLEDFQVHPLRSTNYRFSTRCAFSVNRFCLALRFPRWIIPPATRLP